VLRIFSPEKSDGFGRVWTRELGYQKGQHATSRPPKPLMMMIVHENLYLTTRNYSLQEGNQIQDSYLIYFGHLKWNPVFLSTGVNF
jgi:hypothetical protein